MPELPEIEVIRRGLQAHLPGRRIEDVLYNGKALRKAVPLGAMQKLLTGRTILAVDRRAKFLLLHFDNGAALIVHLGMTGRLGLFAAGTILATHDHIRWLLDNGLEMRYHDARRFGSVQLVSPDETAAIESTVFSAVGPEPFSRGCSAHLQHQAKGKKQPIKMFLMDMKILAGVGNIYANESLFSAGIHPARPAGSLSPQDWRRLLTELRVILRHAIDCGGSTISDYLNAGGKPGYFQIHFRVYGKKDAPCQVCGAPIRMVRMGGRATYFCPSCQKEAV
jgi:formamidopyrimidine-DNA glycosylase